MRNIIYLLLIIILASCVTHSERSFCQDWATDDGSGFSEEWFPSAVQMETIKKDFAPEREYICAVKNPSGKVSVITTYKESKYWILDYQIERGRLTFTNQEVLVGSH